MQTMLLNWNSLITLEEESISGKIFYRFQTLKVFRVAKITVYIKILILAHLRIQNSQVFKLNYAKI